jgi:hypothetical protein
LQRGPRTAWATCVVWGYALPVAQQPGGRGRSGRSRRRRGRQGGAPAHCLPPDPSADSGHGIWPAFFSWAPCLAVNWRPPTVTRGEAVHACACDLGVQYAQGCKRSETHAEWLRVVPSGMPASVGSLNCSIKLVVCLVGFRGRRVAGHGATTLAIQRFQPMRARQCGRARSGLKGHETRIRQLERRGSVRAVHSERLGSRNAGPRRGCTPGRPVVQRRMMRVTTTGPVPTILHALHCEWKSEVADPIKATMNVRTYDVTLRTYDVRTYDGT